MDGIYANPHFYLYFLFVYSLINYAKSTCSVVLLKRFICRTRFQDILPPVTAFLVKYNFEAQSQ